MDGRTQTAIFLGLWLLTILVWDLYARLRFGPEATVSHVAFDWSQWEPAIVAAIFFALGHVFWPQSR
jgi:hypothetical protein